GSEWAKVRSASAPPILTAADDTRDRSAAALSVLRTAQSEDLPDAEVLEASVAPATVTTSTRTITNGAPRMTIAREASYEVASNDSAMDAVAAYTAAQAAKALAASTGAGALR
ncbi:hypothetical protein, partial [Amaricoccus sp.]|uniref:hypothetical protein n=1 Tax=Amaricoccus sp. TaxID=1872485 RepID=UPI002C8B08CA